MSQHPKPLITQKHLAEKLGLSQATVSKALKNEPRVDEATRARVQTAARELGYEPNAMAAGLAHFKQTSKVKPIKAEIAWINAWPDPKKLHSFREFDLYWQGASKSAEKHGYRLEEFVVTKECPLPRIEGILRSRNINGILIPPHGSLKVDWNALNWKLFSAVRFGRTLQGLLPFHSVTADQAENASLAFSKIREHGYERIGFAGVATWKRFFLDGYLRRQLDEPAKLRIPPLLVSAYDFSQHQKSFEAWLKRYHPDAILTEMSEMPEMLKRAGYRVPHDIALAGTSAFDIPGIDAGIDQYPLEIGRVAMLVLISLINDNDRGAPPIKREILIKGDWVEGTSLPPRA